MSAFDEMTLGEVEVMTRDCLGGKSFADADPMQLAGAVMFMAARKEDPSIEWQWFKDNTKMSAIKDFSIQMEADDLNPQNAATV